MPGVEGWEVKGRFTLCYGHLSQEAVGMNGQTWLRVQRKGWKIYSQITKYRNWSRQRPCLVQTFGHELPRLLDLDGHSVKPPKVKPKVQRKKEHPILFLVQKNPSNLTTKILIVFYFFMKKNQRPLNHSLGFHFYPTQTSFESPSPWSQSIVM